MEVDILEFKVPVENNKTVFVWDVPPSHSEAQIYAGLHDVFSSFGPLYLLKVCPNAPLHPPGFYALVKFYSAAQASEAQRQTDGRPLLHSAALKVRLSSKQSKQFLSGCRPLSHARCVDLANHCLGFNGWTSDIITIKELTNEEEEGEEDGGGTRRRLRFGCLLQLCFPRHTRSTRAAAVMEDSFTCTGPEVMLQKRVQLQRAVRERALVQAFSAVLLILLGDGKVMVEVKQSSDQLLPEHTEGLLQVNQLSCREFAADEEGGI
ncbi:RAD52 motif-containing protein 1 [Cottoperca gobio]|uniref:RAD52 motif-containing protein 1 n=1 Tax=Cottoperca gobio TaxID=56716 RepID=A0A6J2PBG4_COTGO|nr:RAD52 motif-containing protein 1 [Cottoperca gobio]XP_029282517.1 RAD52 motif-containing protein 1 [Cottoperca gobio]